MKKRTKITLRTKIYLTIAGLLALTGVFYAQCPPLFSPTAFSSFSPSGFPTGVAAAPDLLLVSEYCSENIDTVDCNGVHTLFAMLPGPFAGCKEKYMAIAPLQSSGPPGNFTARDVFVTEGANVYQISGGILNPNPFATLAGCTSSGHTGITFDHFGTFGNDMIVTCEDGNVYRINGFNIPSLPVPAIAHVFPGPVFGVGEIEGPAVVPPGFGFTGGHGGEIWVADDVNGAIHTIKNNNNGTYTVTQNILSHDSAEGVFVIPNPPCTFTPVNPPCNAGQGNGAFFLAEQQLGMFVWKYPLPPFTGLGGNVLLTSESGGTLAATSLVTVDAINNVYVQCSFGLRVPGNNEGASFVDCGVPTATPTPAATATFTPTPTATATATATATPTPTPTPTPTTGGGCTESTSISTGFNAFPIASGNYLWFSSVLKAKNLPSNATVTVTFTNQTITIPGFVGSPVSVPPATVMFVPCSSNCSATTTDGGTWTTTVPSAIKGNTFLSGLSLQVPGGLPGSIRPVTWSGTISIDTPGVSICWQWAAANYPTFSANGNALGVKPVDDKTLSIYQNADHAGTPENFKQFVVGGGTGGGASNYTGSLSGTKCVCQ